MFCHRPHCAGYIVPVVFSFLSSSSASFSASCETVSSPPEMKAWSAYRARTHQTRALPGTLPSIAPFEKPAEGKTFPDTKLLPPNYVPINKSAFSTFEDAHRAIRAWDMKRAEVLFYQALRELRRADNDPELEAIVLIDLARLMYRQNRPLEGELITSLAYDNYDFVEDQLLKEIREPQAKKPRNRIAGSEGFALDNVYGVLVASRANADLSDPSKELWRRLESQIPYDPEVYRTVTIFFEVANNGRFRNIRFDGSSGSFDFDFACISSILSSQLMPEPVVLGRQKMGISVSGEGEPNIKREWIGKGLKDFRDRSHCRGTHYVWCHLVPISVSWRYPGLFSERELCDSKNIRAIERGFFGKNNEPRIRDVLANAQFRQFFEDWNGFFERHPHGSRAEIEQFAQQLAIKNQAWLLLPEEMKSQ